MNHELASNFLLNPAKFKQQLQRVLNRTPNERAPGNIEFWVEFFRSIALSIQNTQLGKNLKVNDVCYSLGKAHHKSKTQVLKLAFKVNDQVILRSISIGQNNNILEGSKYSNTEIEVIENHLFGNKARKNLSTTINLEVCDSKVLHLNIKKVYNLLLEDNHTKSLYGSSGQDAVNIVKVTPVQLGKDVKNQDRTFDTMLDLISNPASASEKNVEEFFSKVIDLYNQKETRGSSSNLEASSHGFTYGLLTLIYKYKYKLDIYVEQSAGKGFLDIEVIFHKMLVAQSIINTKVGTHIIGEFKTGNTKDTSAQSGIDQMYKEGYNYNLYGINENSNIIGVGFNYNRSNNRERIKVDMSFKKQVTQSFISEIVKSHTSSDKTKIEKLLENIYYSIRSEELLDLVILGNLLSQNNISNKKVFTLNQEELDSSSNIKVTIFSFKHNNENIILTITDTDQKIDTSYNKPQQAQPQELDLTLKTTTQQELDNVLIQIQKQEEIHIGKRINLIINSQTTSKEGIKIVNKKFNDKNKLKSYLQDITIQDIQDHTDTNLDTFTKYRKYNCNINIDAKKLLPVLNPLKPIDSPPQYDIDTNTLATFKKLFFEIKDLISYYGEAGVQSLMHGLYLTQFKPQGSLGHGRADGIIIDTDQVVLLEFKFNKNTNLQLNDAIQQGQTYIKYLKSVTKASTVPGIVLNLNKHAQSENDVIIYVPFTGLVARDTSDEGGQSPVKQSRIRSGESHINVEETLPEVDIGGASRTIGVHSGVKRKNAIVEELYNFEDFKDKTQNVKLKKVKTSDKAEGASCSGGQRQKRNIENCVDEEEADDFSYEPLEKDITATKEQIKEARLYPQIAMMLSKYMGNPNAALDNILTYNRNVGEIINEGELNHSVRELKLLQDHYKDTHEFIARYHNLNSDNNLNNRLLQEYSTAVPNQNSWLVDNGSHSLLVISDKSRYKLYSSDFNYRYLFQTKEGTTFAEVMVLAKAFFKWCSGSTKYKIYILSREDNLVQDAAELLKDALILANPDKFLSDRVLLSREHHDAIEDISVKTIRELFCIDDKPVDITMLNSDFFHDYGNNIKFRAEELHKVLPFVSEQENTALVAIIKRYNIYADTSYLDKVSIDERPILEDYNNQVMSELKEKDSITSERLSEISWNTIGKELEKYPDISSAYKKQILETSKLIHESSFKNIWIKGQGVATQALFFLPDIIRAANTGNAESLVQNVAMLGGDAVFNQLYTKLIQGIESAGSVEAARILSKIPITSPILKFIVMKSIVELHQQLATLPYDSAERNIIKHQLAEQYATMGVMVAELFGIETGPLWVALIMEQLIYAGEAFRKLHHLHIDRGEAILMSLGFEQDKFEDIMEDRKLVNVNLLMMNQTENALKMQFGYKIVKVPVLGRVEWNKVNEEQIPEVVKNQTKKLEEAIPQSMHILKKTSYLEIAEFKKFIQYRIMPPESPRSTMYKITRIPDDDYWEKADYYTTQEDTTIKFASYDSMSCNEVNIFQSEESEKNFQHKLVQPVEDDKYCEERGTGGTFNTDIHVSRGLSPKLTYIKIQGGLAAVYVNIKTPLDNTAQRTLCVTFDPREGNLELDLEDLSGVIDILNTRYRPAPSLSNIEKYIFVIHITHKPYPSSIIFPENANSKFSIQTGSNSIIPTYYIDVTIPFQVQDKSSITLFVFLSPMNHNANSTIHNMYIHSSPIGTYEISYAKYSRGIMNGQNVERVESVSDSSIVLEGKREYLEIVLSNILIDQNLKLSAKHVKVSGVQGKDHTSLLILSDDVETFNLTIAGNIKIYRNKTDLYVFANNKEIKSMLDYSGQFYIDTFLYKLQVGNLQPVLNSIEQKFLKVKFNIMEGIQCIWNTRDHTSNLRIESSQDNKYYSLLIQLNNASLKVLDSNNHLTRIEVKHSYSKGSLDYGLILENNGNFNISSNSSLFNITEYQEQGVSLIFQSYQKYKALHHFPHKNKITINNIDYTIRKEQIYVCAKEGYIDANKLIKYIQPNGNNSITVPIFINTLLKNTKISVTENTLHINNATFHNLPDNIQIHFRKVKQPFSITELKDTLSPQWDLGNSDYHRSRREVDANSEPVTSSASKGTSFISDSIKWFKNCLIEGVSKLFDRTTTSFNNFDSAKFHNFANDKYKQLEIVSKDKVLSQYASKLDNGNRQTNNILESVKSLDVNDSLHFLILLAGQFFGTNETLVNNSYLSSEQKRQIELNELEQKVLSALEQSEDHFNQSNLDNQPQWYQEWLQENNILLGTVSDRLCSEEV